MGFDTYGVTVQSEVIRLPTVWALSLIKSLYNPYHAWGVAGHNTDRRTINNIMNTADMTVAQLSRMYQTKQLRSKIEISYRTWMAQAHSQLVNSK